MTLAELLQFSLFLWGGYFCGKLLGSFLGVVGWIIGFIGGTFLTGYFCISIRNWIFGPLPEFIFPECINPECRSKVNYKVIERTKEGWIVHCQCGARYMQSEDHFYAINEKGEPVPYMRRIGKGGCFWEMDSNVDFDGNG